LHLTIYISTLAIPKACAEVAHQVELSKPSKTYNQMPEVIVRKGEPIDRALKNLKSKMEAEGIMEEVRRLRAFETPTQKTKRKAKSNARKAKAKRNAWRPS
jgi:small subunit ribosomal protein S21